MKLQVENGSLFERSYPDLASGWITKIGEGQSLLPKIRNHLIDNDNAINKEQKENVTRFVH